MEARIRQRGAFVKWSPFVHHGHSMWNVRNKRAFKALYSRPSGKHINASVLPDTPGKEKFKVDRNLTEMIRFGGKNMESGN